MLFRSFLALNLAGRQHRVCPLFQWGIMVDINKFVWSETYRPRTPDQLIAPKAIRDSVDGILSSGNIPNMLLTGRSGIGKTTIARMLVENLGLDYIVVNASLNGNIDTLRNDIQSFASTVSFSGGRKVVILDEFDYSNPQSTQPALRGFMDMYVENCCFIATANYRNKIIPALLDRFEIFEFNIPKSEYPKLSMQFAKRCEEILKAEGATYDRDVLMRFVIANTPNWRKTLNMLQKYNTANGCIDIGILSATKKTDLDSLLVHLKTKNYSEYRKWISTNTDGDVSNIFTDLSETIQQAVIPASIAEAIIIIARYQYQAAFVADQQINLSACFAELSVSCQFV